MYPLFGGDGEHRNFTVMVLVVMGRVVVALFVAVNVLVLVVFAMTRAPQMTDCGNWGNEPGLPT